MAAQDQGRMQVDRLDRLLDMAGPEVGAELLSRLAEDLARVGAALTAAVAAGDRAAVRAETHILIAVAGSVGGIGLAEDARTLNTAAHKDDDMLDPRLIQAIARDLATLQALVAARVAR
jgi:two-component system aerobic respiration control sensor histidine kinase ArcB